MEIFNLLQQLGRGNFGTVYLCERKHNKVKIVVKVLNKDLNSKQAKEAKTEVTVLKKLNHPNIIQYYDSFRKNHQFHIVMEYARYGSLYDTICANKPYNFLPMEKVVVDFCQMVSAVQHIHSKKIIHRDLKSENIFYTGVNARIVKIGDFGISKLLKNEANKADTVIGTTNYLAPEVVDGLPYDMKSDIWALGCILYELCALERLFDGSVSNIVLSIKSGKRKLIDMKRYGTDVQRLIENMLQLNANDRPSATNLLADIFIFPITLWSAVELGNIY